jgi:hypothetical protein
MHNLKGFSYDKLADRAFHRVFLPDQHPRVLGNDPGERIQHD